MFHEVSSFTRIHTHSSRVLAPSNGQVRNKKLRAGECTLKTRQREAASEICGAKRDAKGFCAMNSAMFAG